MTTIAAPQLELQNLPTAWDFDPAHSSVTFSVKHLMIATVRGKMDILRASVVGTSLDDVRIEAQLNVGSIDTGVEQRDAHLRSPDFFDAPNHPTIEFVATRVEQRSNEEGRIHGDLTIRGVTRPIVIDAEIGGFTRDPQGKQRVGVSARATIDRTQWGLTWNQALETGGWLVGDKVKVDLELSFIAREN